MPTFAYQAVDRAGKRLRGKENAVSGGALSRALEDRGLLVIDVSESSGDAGGGGGGGFFKFGRRREVLEVTRALAALLPVGMPLAQALKAASGVASGEVRTALEEVRARVERGDTLSTALAAHPCSSSRKSWTLAYVGFARGCCRHWWQLPSPTREHVPWPHSNRTRNNDQHRNKCCRFDAAVVSCVDICSPH